eukprot:GHUV01014248.1.p2 GENE.GHUV01014248.1~~GHUV01014248.1.p2  ORF type:complete len:193 (-),score=59.08 GHUV01014248.1:440-1018(-)
MALQEHDFVVKHRPGVQHINADVLSRWPQASEADSSCARMDAGPVVAPALPEVEVQGARMTGQQRVEQLGPGLAEQFAQQWAGSRKRGHADPSATAETGGVAACVAEAPDPSYAVVEAGWEPAAIDGVAPAEVYFLQETACAVEEVETPSSMQVEDWELQDVVRMCVSKAAADWQPSHGSMTGGGRGSVLLC